MTFLPGLAHAPSVAQLETQESELELDATLSALVVSTRGQIVVDALLPELAHSPCAPWCSLLPKLYTNHTVGVELSAIQPMAMLVDHPPTAEVVDGLPVVMIFGATVEHLG